MSAPPGARVWAPRSCRGEVRARDNQTAAQRISFTIESGCAVEEEVEIIELIQSLVQSVGLQRFENGVRLTSSELLGVG
jgi:hypothetical protein